MPRVRRGADGRDPGRVGGRPGGDPADLGNSLGTFQTWVYNTVSDVRPEVTFEYGEVGALPAAAIGIENILGDRATSLVGAGDPSSVIGDGGTVCLDYEGFVLEPVTLSYDVTVDEDAHTGIATNAAVHVTDDPFALPVTASVDVAITGNEPPPCTVVISGFRPGVLNVTSGITCLQDATLFGTVKVAAGAGFRSTHSAIVGAVKATGAGELTVCGTVVLGEVQTTGAAAVTIGDPPNGCAGNIILGSVKVDATAGPSVVGGNGIFGKLACTGNDPPPTNGGSPNTVLGRRTGQCAGL